MVDRIIPARSYAPAFVLAAGDALRIEDTDGQQAADVVLRPVDDSRDWLSCIYTQLLNRTTRITTGHVLYSKRARPLATVVDDTAGVHWFGGGSAAPRPTPTGTGRARARAAGRIWRRASRSTSTGRWTSNWTPAPRCS